MSRHDKGRREVAPPPPWRRIASTQLKGHLMSSKDHPQSPALPPFSENSSRSQSKLSSPTAAPGKQKNIALKKLWKVQHLKRLIGEKQSLRAHLRWFREKAIIHNVGLKQVWRIKSRRVALDYLTVCSKRPASADLQE